MKNMVNLLDAPKLREKSSPIWALKSSQYWEHQKHPIGYTEYTRSDAAQTPDRINPIHPMGYIIHLTRKI